MPLPPRHVMNRRASRFGLYVAVTLFGLVLVLPFYYMVVTSFKTLEEITKVRWRPEDPDPAKEKR